MKPEDMTLPETHIEKMDRLRLEHEQRREIEQISADRDVAVAAEKRKEERARSWAMVGIAFVVGLVALGIVAAIYFGVKDDPSQAEMLREREAACLDSGGGWVPKDMLDDYIDDAGGLCVYPGKKASE